MPKWKQDKTYSSVYSKDLKFVDKLFNTLYLTHYLKDDIYFIEYYTADSQLRQRCQNLPGYEHIPSYKPHRGSGIRLKECRDKEVMSTFLEQIDISNPLENVKADVFAFFGLPVPVAEEKFIDASVSARMNELTAELKKQQELNARQMAAIAELQEQVARLQPQSVALNENHMRATMFDMRETIRKKDKEIMDLKGKEKDAWPEGAVNKINALKEKNTALEQTITNLRRDMGRLTESLDHWKPRQIGRPF